MPLSPTRFSSVFNSIHGPSWAIMGHHALGDGVHATNPCQCSAGTCRGLWLVSRCREIKIISSASETTLTLTLTNTQIPYQFVFLNKIRIGPPRDCLPGRGILGPMVARQRRERHSTLTETKHCSGEPRIKMIFNAVHSE